MNGHSRGYIASALWVLAAALMVYGTFDYHRDGTPAGFAWGLFVSAGATTVTTWHLVERGRNGNGTVSVEQIAEVVDAIQEAKQALSRLH